MSGSFGRRRGARRCCRSWTAPTLSAATVLVVSLVIAVVLPLHGPFGYRAGAQSIEDARSEAEALEAELNATRERLIELAEEYNRATADLEGAKAEVAANRARMDGHRQGLDDTKQVLRNYAVEAYVAGGSLRELDGFFATDIDRADRRRSYIDTANGDQQQIINDLRAASARVQRQQERLAAAEAVAATQQERLLESRREATELEQVAAGLFSQANGRLGQLVAEAAQRRAEADQAAAAELALAADSASEAARAASRAAAAAAPLAVFSGANAASAKAAEAGPVVYVPPAGLRPEAARAVAAAMSQLGVPYVWGGANPSQGFDCSGLTQWAWGQAGVSISRPADYQRDDAIPLRYEDLQPGDLVFYGDPPSHMGMYIGNDEIINAPQTGEVVSIKTMWYSRKPMSYGRVA